MSTAFLDLEVPGDKSITHRALMLAALARGTSRLRGLLTGADPQATAEVLRRLGVTVPSLRSDAEIVVDGVGLLGLREPDDVLDCMNSGTTARLLLGILAGQRFSATLTGDESLRSRPMRRVTVPLQQMGARFEELGAPDRLPIRVTGGDLRPIDYVSPKASAQVKSALLLAGLTGGARVRVTEPYLSRDHTERMLRAMGARLLYERGADGSATVFLEPPSFLEPLDLDVPGDFSSAAFFIARAILGAAGEVRLRGVGVNPTRAGLLDVLRRMGAFIQLEAPCDVCGEPVADITARPSRLKATEVTAAEVPSLIDEIPVLAVLAARAEGVTRITGADELRVKESDRIAALAANLRAIGVEADELPDGLEIRGTDAPLRGSVRAFHDHRIAMAFGVLAAVPGQQIRIDEPEVVAVSYPAFWQDLERCAPVLGPA